MEANKAPEKIYVEIRHPFGGDFTEMLGFEHRGNSDDIEYIRTDAFMKKVENFLEMLGCGFTITDNITHDKEQLIEDFKNYMKGE